MGSDHDLKAWAAEREDLEKHFYIPDKGEDSADDAEEQEWRDLVLGDANVEQGWETIEEQKNAYLKGVSPDLVFFKVTLMGKGWTLEHKGKALA